MGIYISSQIHQHTSSSKAIAIPEKASKASTATMSDIYKKVGRGGAGNYYSKQDIADATKNATDMDSTETTRPAEAPAQRVMGSSKPTYRGGRGGAGNYFDDGEEARRIEEERVEEERRKREVQGRVEEDVERGLKRPERAYSGN